MNRVIKFRLWDTQEKKMHEDYGDGRALMLNQTIQKLQANGWVLMKFTGLVDKNGKEICEGDVVEHGATMHGVYWNKEMGAFCLTALKGIPLGAWIPSTHMEVIGNIYENSDLLV